MIMSLKSAFMQHLAIVRLPPLSQVVTTLFMSTAPLFSFVSFIPNQFPSLLAALFRCPLFPRIPHTKQFDQQQCQQLSSFVMALNEKPRHFFNDTTRRDAYLSSSNYCSRSFLNNFLIDDDKWVELIFKYRLLQIQSTFQGDDPDVVRDI